LPKNIVIAEGTQGKVMTGVEKIRTQLQGGGTCTWIPQDEAGEYANMKSKTINANGEYNPADDECVGYSKVKVNVKTATKAKRIEANGTYNAKDDSCDGFSTVTVNVPGAGNLGTKKITANGNYRAQADGFDGYSSVSVDISGGDASGVIIAGVMMPAINGVIVDIIAGEMNRGVT
jgi:hypothetical protein